MAQKQKNNRNTRWEADIAFVFQEVGRIHAAIEKGDIPFNLMPREDFDGDLPGSNGGSLICGLAAQRKIWAISEEYLLKAKGGNQVEISSVVAAFKKEIVDRFLAKRQPVSGVQIDQAIAQALKLAKKERVTITHYIPCHLAADKEPASITIGPVAFLRTSDFLRDAQPGFDKYIAEFGGGKPRADNGSDFVDPARRYYEHFDWVAEVTISDFAPRLSVERARLCVRAALDVFRFILGNLHGDHIRAEGPGIREIEGARIVRLANGEIDISLSRSLSAQWLGDNWWPHCVAQFTEERLEFVGSVVRALTVDDFPPPLCQRLLDALDWFGQAVSEDSPGAAVTKFVTAIERVTQCGKKDDDGSVAKQFRDRSASFCVDLESPNLEDWKSQLGKLYALRSDIAHGSISPLDPSVKNATRQAEKLAQRVVVRAFDFFQRLGAHDDGWNPKKLDKTLEGYVQWAHEVFLPEVPPAGS